MISWDQFEHLVINLLERDIDESKNPEQNSAISSNLCESLFIVAGPGSGKTTVIVLKILKSIFVDGLEPSSIIAVTFTRKAAFELKSRILGWGDKLKQSLIEDPCYISIIDNIKNLDLNNIITGTLDSISEEILSQYRTPGTPKNVVIDNFVSNALMTVILLKTEKYKDEDLKNYLIDVRGDSWGFNTNEMSIMLLDIKDRFYNDRVDVNAFRKNCVKPGAVVACDCIQYYIDKLNEKLLFDFAHLEFEFLSQLRSGRLNTLLQNVKLVVIDEYQDTNLLQEQIYLELAKSAIRKNGSIVVVGDDDQSLFRFRGATVDLFEGFQDTIKEQLNLTPSKINLSKNYRSTSNIVDFCNNFIHLDHKYQASRVYDKPQITTSRKQPFENYPVLGMFRDDARTLAYDLSIFIHSVIHGEGVKIQDNNGITYNIIKDSSGGSIADILFLCSSPQEINYKGDPKLPLLLKNYLNQLEPNIQVFNPRGQNLETIIEVQVLCGLILECIDPNRLFQKELPDKAVIKFDSWRNRARNYIDRLLPTESNKIKGFINAFNRSSKKEVSLIDLIYNFMTWIPSMQDSIEGLVCLEAVTRTVAQSILFSYSSNPILNTALVKDSLWDIFVPIAMGSIKIDEDLLETLPKSKLNIMSIHQAKGLEFPLVIVDVGSDFKTDHPKQRFKRFPEKGNNTCKLEDELRSYSILGQSHRSAINRSFDDLIRQYFVAFSRPQDLLLLVGLNSSKKGYPRKVSRKVTEIYDIPNIATGWDRSANWIWGRELKNLIHI